MLFFDTETEIGAIVAIGDMYFWENVAKQTGTMRLFIIYNNFYGYLCFVVLRTMWGV